MLETKTIDEFMFLGLELIAPSLTNPRKTFNQTKLEELAASIKASGVHQPILVRPLPAGRVADTSIDPATGKPPKVRPAYELVCGERRHRASKLAEQDDIPAMIRELSDDQVREIQIVENLQRDDLTELEEAEGYEQLMQHSSLTTDQVAEKIGKSRSYVYGRLKLMDLSLESKQALREGKIDASRAILIARIPDGKLQIKALEFATTPHGYPTELPSVRALQGWLKSNVMLKLEHAVFKITDARLVELAGSCSDCPKRTGANPDLFSDVDSADICTDPDCFHGKEAAHRAQMVKKAEAKGMRVVQEKEALELLGGYHHRTTPEGYTALSNQRLDLSTEGERPVTLGQALGKDAPSPILFIHPKTQAVSELVPEEEAEAVLIAKGLVKTGSTTYKPNVKQLENDLHRMQSRFEREQSVAVDEAIVHATVEAVRATDDKTAKTLLGSTFLRAWLHSQVGERDDDELASALGYVFADSEDETDALTMHIKACSHADLCRAFVLCLMHDENQYGYDETEPLIRNALAEQLEIPVKALTTKAVKGVKAKFTAEIKELQAQIEAQKTPLNTAQAALQEGGSGGGSKARAPKRKLTAEEATQGIADAIQNIEGSASANAVALPKPPGEDKGVDPLYDKALALITSEQKANMRLLKDHLQIGQAKALQLLSKLEANGKVSAAGERGSREVLVAA